MPLNPAIKRLIDRAYQNDLGNLHLFDENKIRNYLRHPRIKTGLGTCEDYKLPNNITIRGYAPYNSNQTIIKPAIIFISATAFVLDRLGASDDYCRHMANTLNMRVFNIQHRLAPEHKFPVYLDDCVDGILWIANQAAKLKIDPNKIGIWGESSGATIAASCTHALKNKNIDLIKHQTLFYPMVDLVTPFPSKLKYGSGYMLDQSFINWLDQRGFTPEQDRSNPYISPLLSENFALLPPATIITAKYDPLRDEGLAYTDKLRNAQVPVFHKQFDDMIHGFMRFYGKIDAAQDAFTLACEQLASLFSTR